MKISRTLKTVATIVFGVGVLFISGTAFATNIRGNISSTLTIMDDSQLVGNVTCTVTGAACISFGASGIALKLNGFSITGQADAITACTGSQAENFNEVGILLNGVRGAVIQGPGIVRQLRGAGIYLLGGSSRVRVVLVTVSTNCASGILVGHSPDNEFEANIAVRNGSNVNPCGGICLFGESNRNRVRGNRTSGNGYAIQGSNFGIGLLLNRGLTPNENVIVDNIVVGNTNGIVMDPGVKGNIILRNLVVGNPAVQVSVNNPTTTGVDIRNAATPGDNIVEGNVCLTAVNAVCSILDAAFGQR